MLRCALLKHLRRETCRGLEFALRDSLSARRFARVEAGRLPGKSALQSTIGSIRAETWERINRCLLGAARDEKVEPGDQVRVDSTVTHTHILEPSDSQLLRDGVRVLTRLLAAARDELGAEAVRFHDHRRAAKRARTYRKLLRLLARTVGYVEAALPAVSAAGTPWARAWAETAAEYGDLLARVVDQTTRRVFEGDALRSAAAAADLTPPVARRRGPVRTTGGRPLPVRFETADRPAKRAPGSSPGGEMGRDPSGIGHFLSPGEACEIMIGPLQPSLDSKARPYTDKN